MTRRSISKLQRANIAATVTVHYAPFVLTAQLARVPISADPRAVTCPMCGHWLLEARDGLHRPRGE